jgi:hypothetical protein
LARLATTAAIRQANFSPTQNLILPSEEARRDKAGHWCRTLACHNIRMFPCECNGVSIMNISFVRCAAAAAFAVLLTPVTTPASAQCEPSFCNSTDVFGLNRLPPQAQAEPLCLFDPVVWVNTKSHVYHVAGSRGFGHSRYGAYMCETEAKSAGNRAAPY